jgi:hypothetical protein
MDLHVAGGVRPARQEAGIVLARRIEPASHGGHVVELADLRHCADGESASMDGDPHRSAEAAEVGVEVVAVGAENDQLAGLVGADEHGSAEGMQ